MNKKVKMKERPIPFSTEIVKAILEDRCSQTRRVIIPNAEAKRCQNSDIVRYCNTQYRDTFMFEIWHPVNQNIPLLLMIRCPYGQVGDRLWVKEIWFNHYGLPIYKATDYELGVIDAEELSKIKWQSPYFMPCWASRLTLEITEIKVERLQEINEIDVEREGTPMVAPRSSGVDRNDFKVLWNSLNAKRVYGWETNPWVWVISFRIEK